MTFNWWLIGKCDIEVTELKQYESEEYKEYRVRDEVGKKYEDWG